MLNSAVTAADAVQNSAHFDPWGAIGVEAGPVIIDLKPLPHQLSVRVRPEQLFVSLMWLRWETFNM